MRSRVTMINPNVEFGAAAAAMRRVGFAQVQNVLLPEVADTLLRCLQHDVAFDLAYRDADGPSALSAGTEATMWQQALARAMAHAANGEFAFAYERYPMVSAYQAGRDPGLALHKLLELFQLPTLSPIHDELGWRTGDPPHRRAGHALSRRSFFTPPRRQRRRRPTVRLCVEPHTRLAQRLRRLAANTR